MRPLSKDLHEFILLLERERDRNRLDNVSSRLTKIFSASDGVWSFKSRHHIACQIERARCVPGGSGDSSDQVQPLASQIAHQEVLIECLVIDFCTANAGSRDGIQFKARHRKLRL